MEAPIHTVAETPAFTRRRGKLGIPDADYAVLLDVYAAEPTYGATVVGTGGLRKGRVARAGAGKSGGYRVFSLYLGIDAPVYLLWMIDKTEEDTITAEQKQVFKTLISQIRKELGR